MMLCMWFSGRPFALGISVTASESQAEGAVDDDMTHDLDDSMAVTSVLRDVVYALRSDLIVLIFCTIIICMFVQLY
jgi:hypothetical protein